MNLRNIFLKISLVVALIPSFAVADEGAEIRIGAVVPLTGSWASYGTQIQNGIELAISESELSGFTIKPVYEDACLPAEAVKAAKKLASIDKVHAVVGSFCVIGMSAMAPTLEAARIPTFQTSTVSDSILDAGDYIFTTNAAIRDEAYRLAEYAYLDLSARTADVMHVETQWGQDFAKYFAEKFQKLGGEIPGTVSRPPEVNDFRTELTRIKGRDSDVVFAAFVSPNLANLIKQARQLGYKKQFLLTDEAEEQSLLEVAGKEAEGARFFSPMPLKVTANINRFQNRYTKKFGILPSVLAANAYDATKLALEALRICNRETECARNKLYETKDYFGVSGKFSIRKDGGADKPFRLREVKNGRFMMQPNHQAEPDGKNA